MGSRTEKFPFRNAFRAARNWRPLRFVGLIAVRLPIDVSQPLSPNWSSAGHARCADGSGKQSRATSGRHTSARRLHCRLTQAARNHCLLEPPTPIPPPPHLTDTSTIPPPYPLS